MGKKWWESCQTDIKTEKIYFYRPESVIRKFIESLGTTSFWVSKLNWVRWAKNWDNNIFALKSYRIKAWRVPIQYLEAWQTQQRRRRPAKFGTVWHPVVSIILLLSYPYRIIEVIFNIANFRLSQKAVPLDTLLNELCSNVHCL